jgi:nucleoside-diphosphate-sugar epimerase
VKTLLVTGANGFVGRHLVPAARDAGFDVAGTGHGPAPASWPHLSPWFDLDMSNRGALNALPADWSTVVHLAAVSVPSAYKTQDATLTSLHMLMNLTNHLAPTRFLCISSCHVYGAGDARKRESDPIKPQGAYGAAKAMAEIHALSAHRHDVRVARPFNHIGSGMQRDLFLPTLLRRIAAADAQEPIIMDGRNTVRDFLHVEDICRAYLAILAVDQSHDRVFNVCSGTGTSIGTIARMAVSAFGGSNAVAFRDAARSGDDVDVLIGDPTYLYQKTSWTPQVALKSAVTYAVEAARSSQPTARGNHGEPI